MFPKECFLDYNYVSWLNSINTHDTMNMITIICTSKNYITHQVKILPKCCMDSALHPNKLNLSDLTYYIKSDSILNLLVEQNKQKAIIYKFTDKAKYFEIIKALNTTRKTKNQRFALILNLDWKETKLIHE